jgi:hypothetical protein
MPELKSCLRRNENSFIHQTILRLVSQGDALARRALEWIRQFRKSVLYTLRMKKAASANKRRNFDYPANTKGGERAANVRAEANHLSEAERETLFKKGMQMIYGGIVKE